MMFMDAGIGMDTVFGDGRRARAAACWASCSAPASDWSPASRCSPRSTPTTRGRNSASPSPRRIPGKILPMDLRQFGGTLICQKDAFLCAARGVSLGIHFQQKLSVSDSSAARASSCRSSTGEGWPSCMPAAPSSGANCSPGQTLFIDTGCIVAMTPTVSFEIQYVGKVKTALFGGEGLFFAKVTGPGTVWLQSLPFSRLASRVFAAAPQRGGSREEGSVLGGCGRRRAARRAPGWATTSDAGPGPAPPCSRWLRAALLAGGNGLAAAAVHLEETDLDRIARSHRRRRDHGAGADRRYRAERAAHGAGQAQRARAVACRAHRRAARATPSLRR